MAKFTVKEWFAAHEGGTKFYKVWAIFNDAGDGFVLKHWEAYKGETSTSLLPINVSRSRVKLERCKRGQVEWDADKARSAKQGRGYKFQSAITETMGHADVFAEHLRNILHREHADEILVGLAVMDPTAITEMADEAIPEGALVEERPKKAAIPKPEPERPEEWGSW